MNWNKLIRQGHRWVSMAFTLGVVAYMVAMGFSQPPVWFGLFTLVPLILLLISGLYLFALPHAMKARERQRAST